MSVDKREFNRKVFALVLPMALQNLINVGVSATDVLMLGRVGEATLSGCSLGGQVMFVMSLFLFGTTSGASVLTSQYWGKKDTESIEKILAIAINLALAVAAVFTVVTLAIPEVIMGLFTNDAEVIAEGCRYLRIVAFTYPLVGFTMSYLNIIKSVERVLISTIVYASSLIINVIVNAILIFGLFGMPALGIVGAAIGTLTARVLELVITLVYAKKYNRDVRVKVRYLFHMDKVLFGDFMKYSGPVIINELLWGLAYSVNAAIIGHLGKSAVAAHSVAQIVRQLSMVVAFGLGNAATIMLGKAIGEGKPDDAREYANRFLKLTLICGLIGFGGILFIRPIVIAGVGFSGGAAQYLNHFMFVMSYYIIGQALNSTMIVGIFRAGGDTKFGLYVDVCTMWLGSILFGFLAAFVFKWNVYIVYVILISDEIIKLPFSYLRFRQGKWLRSVTR